MKSAIVVAIGFAFVLVSIMPGCIEGLLGNEEMESDPNMPDEPKEPEPSDTNFENAEALMAALDPVLEQLPWDQLISLADNTLGVGSTLKDISDPYMRHWAAKTYYEEITKLHLQSINIYPGYGNPYYNDAGNFIDSNFENRNGMNMSGRIFLPMGYDISSPLSDRLPLLVFCQGVATNKEQYYGWAQFMARNGYIVYTFDVSGQGESEGAGADTWSVRVNDTVDAITYMMYHSQVKHCIDSQKIGTFGHSMGGITVLEHQAVDERVKAAVSAAPISKYNVNMPTSNIPIQIQTADNDGPVAPIPFMCPAVTKQIYEALEGPKEFIVIDKGTHASWGNLPFFPCPTWSWDIVAQYSLGWFNYYLKGDNASISAITTPADHLSTLHASAYDLKDGSGEQALGGLNFSIEQVGALIAGIDGKEMVFGEAGGATWYVSGSAFHIKVEASNLGSFSNAAMQAEISPDGMTMEFKGEKLSGEKISFALS